MDGQLERERVLAGDAPRLLAEGFVAEEVRPEKLRDAAWEAAHALAVQHAGSLPDREPPSDGLPDILALLYERGLLNVDFAPLLRALEVEAERSPYATIPAERAAALRQSVEGLIAEAIATAGLTATAEATAAPGATPGAAITHGAAPGSASFTTVPPPVPQPPADGAQASPELLTRERRRKLLAGLKGCLPWILAGTALFVVAGLLFALLRADPREERARAALASGALAQARGVVVDDLNNSEIADILGDIEAIKVHLSGEGGALRSDLACGKTEAWRLTEQETIDVCVLVEPDSGDLLGSFERVRSSPRLEGEHCTGRVEQVSCRGR